MSMQKISEAIFEKVNGEASQIVQEAEEKSKVIIENAKKQTQSKYELSKNSLLSLVKEEVARISALSLVESRRELSLTKTGIIEDILARVRRELAIAPANDRSLLGLVRDSIQALGREEAIIYVADKDEDAVKKMVANDHKLNTIIKDVRKIKCLGGVIVEDISGNNRIDNTYDTRLQKLMYQLLPDIQKELFG